MGGQGHEPGMTGRPCHEQEEAACSHALHALAQWPVSVELLQKSAAGRRIRALKKSHVKQLSAAADLVIKAWKSRLGA